MEESIMIMNKIDQTIEKTREWRKLVEILYSNWLIDSIKPQYKFPLMCGCVFM